MPQASPTSPPAAAPYPSGHREFIIMAGMLISMVALSIDIMLPALTEIGADLNVSRANDIQQVVASVFVGMSAGMLIFGPLSDSYGRKTSIYAGLLIFIIGSALSMTAVSFPMMIAGRIMQGFGAAAPRVLIIAMVRDKYHGQLMARVMALAMMVFLIVPAIAPGLGQLILFILPWRALFGFLMIWGVTGFVWFGLRQEETLHPEHQKPFSIRLIAKAVAQTVSHRVTRGYTIASSLLFGAFVGYLVSAQQILQIQYQTGVYFPFYFGTLAVVLGLSSFCNSQLLKIWNVEKISFHALGLLCVTSIIFYIHADAARGHPPLVILMLYMGMIFFCNGALFANLTTMAIRPMGHIAGVAISCITALQTGICVIFGGIIGTFYNGTVMPLVSGFVVLGFGALGVAILTYRQPAD